MRRRIALDTGPLAGPRTGIGAAVAHLVDAFGGLDPGPEILPFVVSFRAELPPGTVRLRAPAALALRWWSRVDGPPVDRRLGRPDLVHGTNYVVPPARVPRVVSVYDCWFLRHPADVHPDVVLRGRALRRALAGGAVAHCSSRATAAELESLVPGARTAVVPLGGVELGAAPSVVPDGVPPSIAGGRPYVLAIGTVERRKDHANLVRAFGMLDDAARGDDGLRDLELVIAGSPGNADDDLRRAIAALPERRRQAVHVLGRVDEPTRCWLLRQARVLAYASLDEGFGFPVLEGFAAGVPVVASTAGSLPEVAGEAAVLVAPRDPDALAEAVALVHRDGTTRGRLIAAGTDRLAHFDWGTTASGLCDLYDALVMERR